MPAYVIFWREDPVRDPDEMAKYQNSTRSDPRQYHLKPLVVYGKSEAIEGDAPDGVVVLEFPTVEDAKAWYYSPDYQAAAVHRKNAADYRAVIVEGFQP